MGVDLAMRVFNSGATRDADADKIDFAGFLSPLALKRFGEYMLHHQRQADGQRRRSDNWKLGIPLDAYYRSLMRHTQDVALHFDGYPGEARDTLENELCAVLFNVQGMLHELMKVRAVGREE